MIELELHIVGGYLDSEGTSQALSTSLLHTFSQLADKYQDQVRMSLSTAAISSLNTATTVPTTTIRASDSSSCCGTNAAAQQQQPKSRGLAMNIHTGQVFPVTTSLPAALEGPALEIRSARLWSNQQQQPKAPTLAVIHTSQSRNGCITIEPFEYQQVAPTAPQADWTFALVEGV